MAKQEQELSGIQKAAILLISLGPEKSATIFKHLKEDEIEQLTLEIANTRSVSPQTKEEIINEFYEVCLAQQYIAGRYRLCKGALGEGSWVGEGDGCYQQADLLLAGSSI